MLIESAEAENVDTVIVDGRVLKRGGRLTNLPMNRVLEDAVASLDAMRKRANSR
jgi:hypothetical protein